MPLLDELGEQLKSDIADLKHTGDRYGGSISAALFLREFVGRPPVDPLRHRGARLRRTRARHLPEGRHRPRRAHVPELRRKLRNVTDSSPPPSATRDPAPSSASETRRSPERARVLAPGLYAWLLTVDLPRGPARRAVRRAAVRVRRRCVRSSPASFLESERPALGRWLGIYAFVGLLRACLVACSARLSPWATSTRSVSALGALGWVLYAFGWGARAARASPRTPRTSSRGRRSLPRARLPTRGGRRVAFAVIAALVLEALAFRVERAEPAVFAHAAATACALLVLGVGAAHRARPGARVELAPAATRLNAGRGAARSARRPARARPVWAAFSLRLSIAIIARS